MFVRNATIRCGRIFTVLFAMTLPACAGEPVRPGAPKVVMGQIIAPFALHEECMQLLPGDRLDYAFKSQMPLAFNIHYHEGKVVIMPISRENATEDIGIFRPHFAQDYCLMWEAGALGAIVDYRVALTRTAR
jgi:hypothetical protein